MKVNELRIGNLLSIGKNNIVRVFALHEEDDRIDMKPIDFRNYSPNKDDDIEPIPLTEEWLLKFGFTIIGQWAYKDDFALCVGDFGWHLRFLDIWVNNVHQLQNLYFALTGEEQLKTIEL